MGYFRRQPDRGRVRELVRRLHDLHEEAVGGGARAAWEAIPSRPPRRRCYLRFSVAEEHPASNRRTGIFTAAALLLCSNDLDLESRKSLRKTFDWFNDNLPSPDDLDEDAAIFLFKSDAGECTRRIWYLVRILREHDVLCEMQTIEQPGRILYEDEYQVAVVPWSSSRSL